MSAKFCQNVIDRIEKIHMNPIYEMSMVAWLDDLPVMNNIGYYYSMEDCVHDLNTNSLNIRECGYNEGFILARFPGLYRPVGKGFRIYFKWDEDKQVFFEEEEPKMFEHCSM